MTENDVNKLQQIFIIVLDLPDGSDVTGIRKVTTRKWDSLVHVSLSAAIESEFGVRLNAADSERMTSYESVRLMLDEKLR